MKNLLHSRVIDNLSPCKEDIEDCLEWQLDRLDEDSDELTRVERNSSRIQDFEEDGSSRRTRKKTVKRFANKRDSYQFL